MSLFWAAFSVAVLHTLLPVHWLPYVTVARANRWPITRLVRITLIGTLIHLASTAALTALALLLSYGTTHALGHTLERAGAGVLVALALLYLLLPGKVAQWMGRVTWALAVGVGIQPCIELVPLILAAAVLGSAATLVVGATWAATTVILSMALVVCAYWGIGFGWTNWLARYAYVITGWVLLLSAAGLIVHSH